MLCPVSPFWPCDLKPNTVHLLFWEIQHTNFISVKQMVLKTDIEHLHLSLSQQHLHLTGANQYASFFQWVIKLILQTFNYSILKPHVKSSYLLTFFTPLKCFKCDIEIKMNLLMKNRLKDIYCIFSDFALQSSQKWVV